MMQLNCWINLIFTYCQVQIPMALNIHVCMIECGAKRDHLIHHFWGKFYKILIIKIINNLLTDYFVVVSIQTGMLFYELSLPINI